MHYLKEHLQAIRDRRLKLLQDFAYLTVACHNQMHGLSDLGIANDPTYVDFLRRASEIPLSGGLLRISSRKWPA